MECEQFSLLTRVCYSTGTSQNLREQNTSYHCREKTSHICREKKLPRIAEKKNSPTPLKNTPSTAEKKNFPELPRNKIFPELPRKKTSQNCRKKIFPELPRKELPRIAEKIFPELPRKKSSQNCRKKYSQNCREKNLHSIAEKNYSKNCLPRQQLSFLWNENHINPTKLWKVAWFCNSEILRNLHGESLFCKNNNIIWSCCRPQVQILFCCWKKKNLLKPLSERSVVNSAHIIKRCRSAWLHTLV